MGAYNQTMDQKGRVSFPAKFREEMGDSLTVTRGIDGCLFVYASADFREKAEKLGKLPMAKARKLQRSFIGWACDLEPDKNGRILIPQALRECAGLEKEIVVVGVSERAEIWSKERWNSFNSDIDDNELMDALEGLDF
ncbi:MAG: division/cell wall cluster transcriptional repressor MraZ [Ruminococcus sp.]|nr:division/cell wall cluster transcriptional repressor MraZ [Ruminococcus sp.]